jgi:hypothetical protein
LLLKINFSNALLCRKGTAITGALTEQAKKTEPGGENEALGPGSLFTQFS